MNSYLSIILLTMVFWKVNIESPKMEKIGAFQPINISGETDFEGIWVNEGSDPMVTKCEISFKTDHFIVQMWGSCDPQDCDWGENVTNDMNRGATKFDLLWDSGFAERNVTYEIIDGKLKLMIKVHYKDNSGRTDFAIYEYFEKQ
ncbi:hypothetical protein [Pseudozobellia sp. WGM2]|uniref:hypothetical protein n=1 Tax=Pseudozobellia sp. WGM2 TaxID=2787625 RepID=UPI001AE04565|nr:hypothetical protein [Pseudozobellia sp. WGM2]